MQLHRRGLGGVCEGFFGATGTVIVTIVKAVLHVLVVPGLVVTAMVPVGVVRMGREGHPGTVAGDRTARVRPPRRTGMVRVHHGVAGPTTDHFPPGRSYSRQESGAFHGDVGFILDRIRNV